MYWTTSGPRSALQPPSSPPGVCLLDRIPHSRIYSVYDTTVAMAHFTDGGGELDEDFLLALKLSEGVNQFGFGSCSSQELDEDFLLALKLSEEPNLPGPGGSNGQMELDEDILLALRLSEGTGPSGGESGQVETDAAFARRLEQELNGRASPEDPNGDKSAFSAETSTNVTILRDWYGGSQDEASELADLFRHLNFLDEEMLRERSGLRIAATAKETPKSIHNQIPCFSPTPQGVGFGVGSLSVPQRLGQIQPTKAHDPNIDRKMEAVFDFISGNLNDFIGYIKVSQGRHVPVLPVVSAMLDLSLFSETIEMLLRNDSIKDLADRQGLVKSLLRLLKVMSTRGEYQGIITRPRRLKKRTKGLRGIAQSPPEAAVTSVILLEDEKEPKSQPLLGLLGRLKVQAELYLKGARSSGDAAFKLGEGAASVSLCKYLVEMHGSILRTIKSDNEPKNSRKGGGVLGLPSWLSLTLSVPQKEILPKTPETLDWSTAVLDAHVFKQDAIQITNTLPGRQPKLVRQITELSNLPEGIYARVMEARPDVLKALIVGPKGTPYEGGLFEYEIALPTRLYSLRPTHTSAGSMC
jgi:Ubiquitin-conjugating enzyme